MFRMFGGTRPLVGGLPSVERAAVDLLCEAHCRLHVADSGDDPDLFSEAGHAACAGFLAAAEHAAKALGLAPAPRTYRSGFSRNYQALFVDTDRHYRVDLLEAGLSPQAEICVNSDAYEFSEEARRFGEDLRDAFIDLRLVLDQWQSAQGSPEKAPQRAELASALDALDAAWARFEERHIGELITIESKARQLLVTASDYEGELRAVQAGGSHKTSGAERRLVECIAHLNSIANIKCTGRDDLGYDILLSARHVVQRCEAGLGGLETEETAAARLLADDIIGSYDAMRLYLHRVGDLIDHVDPHLCNNAGLVARLVDWETSWEVGSRYLMDSRVLDALCDVVSELRVAKQIAPELAAMCEDCDAELFLALPRTVVLLYAAEPTKPRASLVQSLLPHRFSAVAPPPPCGGEQQHRPHRAVAPEVLPELGELVDECRRVEALLAPPEGGDQAAAAARRVLVRRSVTGEAHGGPGAQAVEGLMRLVERWSLELQRHCPRDWNRSSEVLLRCLTSPQAAQRAAGAQADFQV